MKIIMSLLLLSGLFFSVNSQAQNGGFASAAIPIEPFTIEIEFDKDVAELSCEEGCHWKELEFSLKEGESIYVSPVGISPRVLTEKKLDFQFILERTDKNSVKLTKVQGMAWKELNGTASPKKSMLVDQAGITISE